ncbi:hypothetical protein C7957_101176 [Halanaerobium saccharolyticum]|uniref:Curlin associated repeat-containing protein n=1 Tax=Halanaerobium saccharolyticum TaxID=43595 RepID=A0A4R6SR86_9FIRM|nr:hypothetical protein [Halanaerobium saccharolyticum]TDQ06140.1 hypothetical protein C7957_101176 [Halanaerobium saccharolyticum]
MLLRKIDLIIILLFLSFIFLALPLSAQEFNVFSLNNDYQLEDLNTGTELGQIDLQNFSYGYAFDYDYYNLAKSAAIIQIGNYNFAQIKQGSDYITISASTVSIYQYGNNNYAAAVQLNKNNNLKLAQYGNNNFIQVEQYRKNSNLFISQFGNNEKVKLYKY